MGQGSSATSKYTRLTVYAFLTNFVLWSLIRAPNSRPNFFVLLAGYLLGAAIGWIIHPFFRPARDRWTKSGYDRLVMRIVRAIFVGGLVALLAQCATLGGAR